MTLPDRILEDAVDAAGQDDSTTGAEVAAQRQRVREHGEAGEESRWQYETLRNLGHIQAQLIHAELDAVDQDLSGSVEACTVRDPTVPLSVQVESDLGVETGLFVHLSPDDAERLAVDLLEQPHAAREKFDTGGRDA